MTAIKDDNGNSILTQDVTDIWDQTLVQLKNQMGEATFTQWLKKTHIISTDNHTFVIGCQSEFAREWLENRLKTTIERTLKGVTGKPAEIKIQVGKQEEISTDPPVLNDFDEAPSFEGFDPPEENWFKCPVALIEAFPTFDTKAELQVVFYILRHTWGYQDFDDYKKITLDEFQNGRKKKDTSRIDNGIGMNKQAIIRGIKRAIEHGFIVVEEDRRDKARSKKCYRLNMR